MDLIEHVRIQAGNETLAERMHFWYQKKVSSMQNRGPMTDNPRLPKEVRT